MILGDTSGKTSIISKFARDAFPDAHVATTADVHTEAIVDVGEKKYRVDI